MNDLIIKSYNTSTKIISNKQVLHNYLIHNINIIKKMIPSAYLDTFSDINEKTDSTIHIKNGLNFNITEHYPRYKIIGETINPIDILAVTEHLLERGRQEKGIYNLHSSAVGIKDKCIIINGASKSGKTLISLNLMENYGINFISNERSLINLESSLLVGGCSSLNLSEYHQSKFSRLKNTHEIELKEIDSTYKIQYVIQPIIDSGIKLPEVINIKKQDAEWSLYPEFTGRIRGDNRRIRGDSTSLCIPLDSLDTKEIAKKRMRNLTSFLDNTPIIFIRGNLESISNYIYDKLSHN